MRSLLICRQFLPVAHGAETQAAALGSEIISLGHSVRVIAGRQNEQWPAEEEINGLPVTRLPSPRKRLLGTHIYLRALKSYLLAHRNDYDVLHVIFAKHDAALAGNLSRRLNRPVVCKPACAGEYGDLKAVWKTMFPRHLLRGIMKIDRLIAISDEIATEWVSAGFPFERIARIPNGVDVERFRPALPVEQEEARRRLGLPLQARIIVGSGRLERQKGFAVLLEAVGRLGNVPDLHVAIAGKGSRREELARLAEALKISDRVHLLGHVKSIEDVYHAADLFVLPSRGEGMSNALLEAMACGLDVAATRVSGVLELIRHDSNGLLAAPESGPSLADALRQWLSAPVGRYGSAARALIEQQYSLRHVAELTAQLYAEVIAERAKTK